MKLELSTVARISPDHAWYCREHLCNPGSEMQAEFRSQILETPVVIASTDRPVSWTATHQWRDTQTIEAFTHIVWRGRGLVRAAVGLLLCTGHLSRRDPVAVFSPELFNLARSVRFAEVRLYQRDCDDWRLEAST